jgi:hypothetical protein
MTPREITDITAGQRIGVCHEICEPTLQVLNPDVIYDKALRFEAARTGVSTSHPTTVS